MWSLASNAFYGNGKSKCNVSKGKHSPCSECSDDEISNASSGEEGLECPICWESFNLVENVPYVLWCGHTLCKNCVLGLPWAALKLPTLPVQLPFFISCPWCNLLSLRLLYKGVLRYPRKNYFILWMVEGMNGERTMKHIPFQVEHRPMGQPNRNHEAASNHGEAVVGRVSGHLAGASYVGRMIDHYFRTGRADSSISKSLALVAHAMSKVPLVVIFLLVILYAIPASAAILALYILITLVFALPSFFVLYFAYPSLDWLVREIFS